MTIRQKALRSKSHGGATANAAKPAPSASGNPSADSQFTGGTQYKLIETVAYLRAERRGFAPGHELEDWLAAEAEIERLSKARDASANPRASVR